MALKHWLAAQKWVLQFEYISDPNNPEQPRWCARVPSVVVSRSRLGQMFGNSKPLEATGATLAEAYAQLQAVASGALAEFEKPENLETAKEYTRFIKLPKFEQADELADLVGWDKETSGKLGRLVSVLNKEPSATHLQVQLETYRTNKWNAFVSHAGQAYSYGAKGVLWGERITYTHVPTENDFNSVVGAATAGLEQLQRMTPIDRPEL